MKRLFVLVITSCLVLVAQGLSEIDSVFVGEMGASDEAARFRLLLEEELEKQGFQVAKAKEEADAVLTGALTVRVYDRESVARANVTLSDSNGKRLWGGDFGPRRCLKCAVFLKRMSEPVRRRAEDIAQDLSKARDKARR